MGERAVGEGGPAARLLCGWNLPGGLSEGGRLDLRPDAVRWGAAGYRLPTEAEWEKAARGGLRGHHYPWESPGEDFEQQIDPQKANYDASQLKATSPVGEYSANGYGLKDMAGNVWEWVWDWFDSEFYRNREASADDRRGPSTGRLRVLRGGSWNFSAVYLRCSYRSCGRPSLRNQDLGFRLALDEFEAWSGKGGDKRVGEEPPGSERARGTLGQALLVFVADRGTRIQWTARPKTAEGTALQSGRRTARDSGSQARTAGRERQGLEGTKSQLILDAGKWQIKVEAPGYQSAEAEVAIRSGTRHNLVLRMKPGWLAEMVLIAGDVFPMGDPSGEGHPDEQPIHSVQVSPFYMDKHLLTHGVWRVIYDWALANGYEFDEPGTGCGSDHPVTNVDWYDVVKWANARSEKEGRPPVYYTDGTCREVYRKGQIDLPPDAVHWRAAGYRLPTEAEWEKAARGGLSGQHYPWESPHEDYDRQIDPRKANYEASKLLWTSSVGKYPSNGFGLLDMAGNVWEWVWDWFDGDWYDKREAHAVDNRGPLNGRYRVRRGGSWDDSAGCLRCAYRDFNHPSGRSGNLGFRLALGEPGEWIGEGPGRGAMDEPPASE